MTLDEAINILKQYIDYDNADVPDFYTMADACEVVVKALEQQPTDAVDRVTIKEYLDSLGMGIKVTPQQKVGQWEWVQYDANPNIGNWHCSECRTIIPDMPEETDHTPIYKWCPMCGSRMIQEAKEC